VQGRGEPGPLSRDAVWCSRLSKSYGLRAALRSVSLRISPGEVVGLLGPNGAGKSTLVKMLVGLVRPDSGEALVLGAPAGRPEARRDVGYLPELFRYQPWMSVGEVAGLHARLRPVPPADRQREVARVLARAGLAERTRDRVSSLSKGLQQRLGLAVALLGRPRLLLLDEPTSALDPTGRADVRALIDECRAEGTTVLLNSHMLSEVERSCDRVIVLDRGAVLADGPLGAWLDHDMLRVRLEGEAAPFVASLKRFGEVSAHGRELTVPSLAMSLVPDVVAALVGVGARVLSVEPGQVSLEEKLLELLARNDGEHR
jgi:ABC-2 type transport system ATP-binding protein